MIASRPTEGEGRGFADVVCLFGTAPRGAVSKCFKTPYCCKYLHVSFLAEFTDFCDLIKFAVDDAALLVFLFQLAVRVHCCQRHRPDGALVSADGKNACSSTSSLSTIKGNRRRMVSFVGFIVFYVIGQTTGFPYLP